MQQQEHVSEEAAKMAKIQGQEGPDVEQGTPVQEILQEEKDTRQQAPEVLKEQIKPGGAGASNTKPSTSTGIRQFSTSTRQKLDLQSTASTSPMPASMLMPNNSSNPPALQAQSTKEATPGHKFPLPTLPLPPSATRKHRYDTIVEQLTNLLMKDGKKATAQRHMATILNILRTSPAPTFSPNRPLIPGHPVASHLPLNPIIYLTVAVDSVAPLLRLRSQRGAAGGGVALQIPVPLSLRQRRRVAFMWVIDAASKRRNMGSGRDMFPQRVAQELISIVEGKSGLWERRGAVHRL